MRNRSSIVLLFVFSIIVLWFLCLAVAKIPDASDGHLPSQEPNGGSQSYSPSPSTPQQSQKEPEPLYNYSTFNENTQDSNLSMHILEIDPSNPNVFVKPVSSHETLFGYAFLSDMNERWKAQASVNGGFSHTDGLLGGLYAIEEELLVPATGKYPVLFLGAGKAFIEDVKTSVWLEGRPESKDQDQDQDQDQDLNKRINLGDLFYNQNPKGEGLTIFTPKYGSQNRIESRHYNAVISNGEVRGLISRSGSYEIPKDGFLISAMGENAKKRLQEAIKPGMRLKIAYEITSKTENITDYDWAYECGSWILKDGQVVVPAADTWTGTLKTKAPRTAVGIKEDGHLVFVVVDGRQKSLSDGLTGDELAQRLLTLGLWDAVFLDGGASSEMMVEGKIVNSPAAGRERMLASSFVILKR